jgi:cytochrome c nitrite reductase small subunit
MTQRKSRGVLIAGLFAVLALSGLAFVLADGAAYLREDPAACANCHVMQETYDGWLASEHATTATCSDCHSPDALIAKYTSKASSGFWHALALTTGDYSEPIEIQPASLEIAEGACIRCHTDLEISATSSHPGRELRTCAMCHAAVGHP